MSRKTRREKIIISQRRHEKIAQENVGTYSLTSAQPNAIKPTLNFQKEIPIDQKNDPIALNYSYIKHDLLRISILSVIALSFEIAIYLFWK